MVIGVQLSAGSRCVKYLMFAFNLLFVITGIVLITIGAVILGLWHDYEHFLDEKFYSVPALLIAIGTIIFFIAFFGCCGAVRENYCMIVTFATLMVLVFVLELAGGISGYVLRTHATTIVANNMNESMAQYNSSKDIAILWDEVQKDFHCCGTYNRSDWVRYFDNHSIPMSCCDVQTGAWGTVTCDVNSPTVHKDNCLDGFLSFVKAHALHLGGVGLGIAFIQFIGIWFAIFLAKSIRNSYETV